MSLKVNEKMKDLKVPNARLSYPYLHKHAEFKGEDKGYYAANLILDPEVPQHKEAIDFVKKAIKAAEDEIGMAIEWKNLKLLNGDQYNKRRLAQGKPEDPAIKGKYILKVQNKIIPLFGLDNQPVPADKIEQTFYAGCYVHAIVKPSFYTNEYGLMMTINAKGLKFAKDGEPLGNVEVVNDASAFDEFGGADDGDDW